MIFKREKEISRSLEFDGMWISEQPSEDNIRGHWDKLVISTHSFPDKYWDKFVKKKVIKNFVHFYLLAYMFCGFCDGTILNVLGDEEVFRTV